MTDPIDVERAHEDRWYRRVTEEGFFEREGFRRLITANLAALERLVPLSSDTRILSLGCGSGEYERCLAQRCRTVVGVDLSRVAVEYAQQRAVAEGLGNVTFVESPIASFEAGPASADVVVILGVLHHLNEAQRADLYARVSRWLVPGGWCYARDPNACGLLRRAAGRLARRDEFHSPNEAALDPHVVEAEWRAAGFDDITIDYTDVIAGPLPWMCPVSWPWFWWTVGAFDRAWLAVPSLRPLASQFACAGRRGAARAARSR